MYRFCVVVIFLLGCAKDDVPTSEIVEFAFDDGFESTSNEISSLLLSDNSRWSNIQQVNAGIADNEISLVDSPVLSGGQSLRILSYPAQNPESKIGIEKGGLDIQNGSQVKIEASFYIKSTASLENLFLIDLECCSCWDPDVADNKCPGVRLKFNGPDYLVMERGKIINETLRHSIISFPRNEWVDVIWEMDLSDNDDAQNRLYINGQKVIDAAGKNMPNAVEFKAEFAKSNIEFDLLQPIAYERVQIGATANASEEVIEMFVDDVLISTK